MTAQPGDIDELHRCNPDFIVVGSGAAGMAAALRAATEGLDVLVLEASSTFGGTTAVSGGVIWAPNNDRMKDLALDDDLPSALAYVERVAAGKASTERIRAWIENAPIMARALEGYLKEPFLALPTYPDYQPELEGGKTGGRSLDNALFDTHTLGEWRPLLRQNPITGRAPMTIGEAMEWGVFAKPFDFPYREVAQRAKDGVVHGGAALMGRSLLRGLECGVRFVANARVQGLVREKGTVCGVRVRHHDKICTVRAPHVLLASGGFDWNDDLRRAFLTANPTRPASIPSLQGDALAMAMRAGAQLSNMAEAWWVPTVEIPGETYDGAPLYRSEFSVRCLPHSIIVNRDGRRFVNEALNYNDVVKPFLDIDPVAYRPRNQPAWLVVDGAYLKQYMCVTAVPGRALPDYIRQADTLNALAEQCGIDPSGLAHEVQRFNGFVQDGQDRDFHRGDGAFERFYGDPSYPQNPNLGAISEPPFCALPIHIGCIGTKGGALTNAHAQVLDVDGEVICGLYAAGNAMASPAGAGYPGAGSTIGIALTFGWLAAGHVANSVRSR